MDINQTIFHRTKQLWPILALLVLFGWFYFRGLNQVPFHPDESTHIYMSKDFFSLFHSPWKLSYAPNQPATQDTVYRAIDAPLNRYLIGLARLFTNHPGLDADWTWSLSWGQNLAQGSAPSQNLLRLSRIPAAILSLTGMVLIFLSLERHSSRWSALAAAFLLGLNPLVLLHGRRAMAEGVLLASVSLLLWLITHPDTGPFLVGLGLALAINAKHTAVFLVPVGIIAVCWKLNGKTNLKIMLTRSAIVLGTTAGATYLLNPFFWFHPFQALQFAAQNRSPLASLQLEDYLTGVSPGFMDTLRAHLINLLLLPPSVAETRVHLNLIRLQASKYLSVQAHTLLQGALPAGIMAALVLGGGFLTIRHWKNLPHHSQRSRTLVLLAGLFLTAGLASLVPLPWQRYTIPLLPILFWWVGIGLGPLLGNLPAIPKTNQAAAKLNSGPDQALSE